MTQLEDAKPASKPFAEHEAPGPSNWLAVIEGCGIVKPGEKLTVAGNFLQVVAGGVLAQKAAALKKLLIDLAAYKGVYMVFVRPSGARPHEWTPVYHGQATDQTVGERCASYLGGGAFCCDTTKDKCKMCKDFSNRGFDVAVMFVPTIESMPKTAEAFMLGGWDFAANMTLNGNKVRPDMEVWLQGKLVRASSFLKLTELPDNEADMVRKAAAASYRQQQLAQAEMADSRGALHSSDAAAASTPGSGSPRVAALSVAVTAAQLTPRTLNIMHGISAAIRPIASLALLAQGTDPAAAAARALDTWLHATGCDGPRQQLKDWGLKVPRDTPMHVVKKLTLQQWCNKGVAGDAGLLVRCADAGITEHDLRVIRQQLFNQQQQQPHSNSAAQPAAAPASSLSKPSAVQRAQHAAAASSAAAAGAKGKPYRQLMQEISELAARALLEDMPPQHSWVYVLSSGSKPMGPATSGGCTSTSNCTCLNPHCCSGIGLQ